MKKLTKEQKRRIYERYCEGERQITLAHTYKVDVQVITKVCHNLVSEFIKPSKIKAKPVMEFSALVDYRNQLFEYTKHITTNAIGREKKERIFQEINRIDLFTQNYSRITL